ncbi:hypothetical protein CCR83_14985 [Rhodobacter veldkampii DSM 11550]|uniref:Uncharacterized protein n=1 Tax=Phaeovulum veldkampii DSM 11550 TaxID=1185920 RepID=A0A2T4JI37_9RHOB|nr:hypothetical protein [Phaeovulum veldkampii]MBK5947717.1 hypothetical protein [Phaeovulum veldkampii DSM 11550]PTE17447.1 hypothetical protein C5F46_09385 [Phaeovulum veldkampii DSM 11550]TDQ60336.1 hypothetical protein EV658_105114 [Phaeovulum veldkampii DSM 11550]
MATDIFNVVCVAQSGRLEAEAVLFAASFCAMNPAFPGRLIVAEPQPGPRWPDDPRISSPVRAFLEAQGAQIVPFEARAFGASYPQGNKIEMLGTLPDAPFVFFDTDTLFTGRITSVGFDFDRPAASMRREGTWPEPPLYGPGYAAIWRSLYDRFGLEFATSLDLSQPDEHWERYLYFNAGWFFHRSPRTFGERFLAYALSIRDDPPEELACQSLDPWLDQIALPPVIHSFGGGRPGPGLTGLDGDVSCHYRALPLLYARESDRVVAVLEEVCAPNKVKKLLREHEPFRKLVYQGKGRKIRAMFDRAALPRREQALRNAIRRAGLWLR